MKTLHRYNTVIQKIYNNNKQQLCSSFPAQMGDRFKETLVSVGPLHTTRTASESLAIHSPGIWNFTGEMNTEEPCISLQ